MKEQKANEELVDHEQQDLKKVEDVFTSINTSIVNTSIASSFWSNAATLNGDDSKKIGEELRCTNLPIVSLSLYSFVHQVQDLIKKMGD